MSLILYIQQMPDSSSQAFRVLYLQYPLPFLAWGSLQSFSSAHSSLPCMGLPHPIPFELSLIAVLRDTPAVSLIIPLQPHSESSQSLPLHHSGEACLQQRLF